MIGHVNSQQGIARGKLIVILLVVAVVVITGGTLIMQFNQKRQIELQPPTSQRAAGDRFMAAVADNNADKSYELMTELSKQNVGGQDAWRTAISDSFGKSKTDPKFLSMLDIKDPTDLYKGQEPRLLTYSVKLFKIDWETSLTIIKVDNTWKINTVVTEPK
ncbi:MAG: hypothetical protein ABWX94_01415 [Candidatus Saccharimonadales bacterium]